MASSNDILGKTYTCVTLAGKSNYQVWAYTMREHLTTCELVKFIENQDVKPEDAKQEQRAKSMILSTLAPDEISKITHCKSTFAIWAHFHETYGKKTANAKLELMSELTNQRCASADQVEPMLNKVLAIKGKLEGLKVKLDDTMTMSVIKNALPNEGFELFLESWALLDADDQTLSRFLGRVQVRAKELVARGETVSAFVATGGPAFWSVNRDKQRTNGRTANSHPNWKAGSKMAGAKHQTVAQSGDSSKNTSSRGNSSAQQGPFRQSEGQAQQQALAGQQLVCNYCKKIGHWKSECHKLKRRMGYAQADKGSAGVSNSQRDAEPRTSLPGVLRAPGHSGSASVAIERTEFDRVSFMAEHTGTKLEATDWIVDSGCSSHMTFHLDWLDDYKIFDNKVDIRIGDNSRLQAKGSGTLHTDFGNIKEVLYVPGIASNLLSISTACDRGAKFIIDGDALVAYIGDREIIRAPRRGGTYVANINVRGIGQAMEATSMEMLHAKLGHLPLPLIRKMVKEELVEGLRLVDTLNPDCIDCKINKCRRVWHPERTTPKMEKPGQSMHFDLIGPVNLAGLGGERFILVGVDEVSGFRFVSCLVSKSETPELIQLIVNTIEAQTGNRPLYITSDNGSEFVNARLSGYLQRLGIQHVVSAPYVPQQNGRAERENYTLLNETRCIINSAKVDKVLWPFAVMTATYIHNRCISTTRSVTPFELWFGRKPNLSNLRRFGQHAIVLKPDRIRGKLDEKGELMLFVSYTELHNTYLFYDLVTKKIVKSCDATFLNSFGQLLSTEVDVSVKGRVPDMSPNCVTLSNVTDAAVNESIQDSDSSRGVGTIVGDNNVSSESTACDLLKSGSDNDSMDQSGKADTDVTLVPNISVPPNTSTPLHKNFEPRALRNQPKRDYKSLATGRWNLNDEHIAKIANVTEDTAPRMYNDIASRDDSEEWYAAMESEMNSIIENDVYSLVPKPNANIIGCRWVFSRKQMSDGSVQPKPD